MHFRLIGWFGSHDAEPGTENSISTVLEADSTADAIAQAQQQLEVYRQLHGNDATFECAARLEQVTMAAIFAYDHGKEGPPEVARPANFTVTPARATRSTETASPAAPINPR